MQARLMPGGRQPGRRHAPPPSVQHGAAHAVRPRATPEAGGGGGANATAATLQSLPLPEGSMGLPVVGETLALLKDGERRLA
jgi:hypothetical protein